MEEKKIIEINVEDILPNRFQPRLKFSEDAILELSESIKEHGVIQPIVVRQIADKYEIIAGERRYKASVMAGKESIPAIVTELNDKDSAEVALIENVQRQNLTPIEEAISYKKILDMGYLTQDKLAEKLGKTQSTVANKLRLLNLEEEVQEALLNGKISERHARSLLKLNNVQQVEVLNKIVKDRLTVRATDKIVDDIIHPNVNIVEASAEANKIKSKDDFILPESQEMSMINLNELESQDSLKQVSSENDYVKQNNEITQNTYNQVAPNNFNDALENEYISSPFKLASDLQEMDTDENNSLNIPNLPIIEEPDENNLVLPTVTTNELSEDDYSESKISMTPLESALSDSSLKPASISVLPIENEDSFDEIPKLVPVEPNHLIDDPETSDDINNNESSTKFFNFDLINEEPEEEKDNISTETLSQFNLNDSPFSFKPVDNNDSTSKLNPNTKPLEFTPVSMEEIENVSNNDNNLNSIYKNMNEEKSDAIKNIKSENYSSIGQGATDLRTVINTIQSCANTVKKFGFKVDIDELDLENIYEITFKIHKN